MPNFTRSTWPPFIARRNAPTRGSLRACISMLLRYAETRGRQAWRQGPVSDYAVRCWSSPGRWRAGTAAGNFGTAIDARAALIDGFHTALPSAGKGQTGAPEQCSPPRCRFRSNACAHKKNATDTEPCARLGLWTGDEYAARQQGVRSRKAGGQVPMPRRPALAIRMPRASVPFDCTFN